MSKQSLRTLVKRLTSRLHRPWFGSGIGAVLVPIAGICLLLFPIGKGLQDWSYDLPFLLRTPKLHNDVVVVGLDDAGYKELDQDRFAFDRSLHARLIRKLNEQGAKLIVFDIVFLDPLHTNTNATEQFAAAMLDRTNVVLAVQYIASFDSGGSRSQVLEPTAESLRASAAGLGLAWIDRDTDFSARLLSTGTDSYPSLGWQGAHLVGAEVAKHPQRRLEERWLNYYSPAPFRTISYPNVLKKPQGSLFSNKVVFVGETHGVAGYLGEQKEEFHFPWTWRTGAFFDGVQVHALSFSNLLHQDWLRRLPVLVEILVIAIIGAMLGYGLSLLRPLTATVVAIGFCLSFAAIVYLLFARFNIWFPWLIVVAAQVPMTLGWAYMVDSIRTYVERQLLETSMELYLSPHQVKEILKEPDLLRPGTAEKTISILFSDIANFSKASEMLHPADLAKLLNDYYEVAIAAVHKTDGTVMNIIGDAIFAIWNAPQEQKDHQKLACEAAVLLNQRVVQFNAGQNLVPLRTRIGLHTGIACVGNIGSTKHFDYAAIGESVNMASRLEGLNKKLKTNILATREIQSALDNNLISRRVGYFRFKGLVQITEVHEVIGLAAFQEGAETWRGTFAEALACWKIRQWDKAEENFRRTLELRSKSDHSADDGLTDGPSDFYLKLIPELKRNPPSPEWLGEIDLAEK